MHWLQYFQIAVYNHRNRTATVYRITLNITDKALIRITINKNLEIHHITQTPVAQCHNTLNDDYRLWLYMNCLWQTIAENITIGWLFNSSSLTQLIHLLNEKFPIKGVWMVEIDSLTLFIGKFCRVIIIRIQRHNSHIMRRKTLYDFLHYGGLSRTSTTSYSYNSYFILHIG